MTDTLNQARFNMVQQQIRPWEVFDRRVLGLLEQLPRDAFVSEQQQGLAYADAELPIGHGQQMMFPRVEARLLQALNIAPGDRILEIGSGSGFVTACLAKLGSQVVSIEIHADLAEQAAKRLAEHQISNVDLRTADALAGPIDGGPFDAIAITGSLPRLPEMLQQQLTIGGRLFVVVGESPAMEATLVTRTGEKDWRSEGLFETDLAALENVAVEARFQF